MKNHANGGGLIGGYPACDKSEKDDRVVCDDERVDCEDCLKIIKEYNEKKKKKA